MRFLSVFMCLILLAAPVMAWEAPAFPKAEIIAVEVYADWCPNCKILHPALEKAKADEALKDAPVLFVKLDYTDKDSVYRSKLLGQALGLEAFMKANGAGTGYVAVLNAETKEEIARINRDQTTQDIVRLLQEKLTQ